MNVFKIAILALGISLQVDSYAQIEMCGNSWNTEIDSSSQLSKTELKVLQSRVQNPRIKSNAIDTIDIQLHIVRNNDSSEIIPLAKIKESFEEANKYYANANMFLYPCADIHYLSDSTYKDYWTEEENELFDPQFQNAYALNAYYFERVFLGEEKRQIGGLGGGSIILSGTSYTTLVHEIGHHYGLAHTHGRFNFEPPDYSQFDAERNGFPYPVFVEGAVRYFDRRSDDNNNDIFDCLETGDGVCDTPAEPVYLGGAYDYETCTYYGTDVDYYGDTYVPRPGNIMSYGGCREEHLTVEQYERMRFVFENRYLNESCGACKTSQTDWVVTRSDDYGKGSLRWILTCNKTGDKTLNITFDIPETDTVHVSYVNGIKLASFTMDGINRATGNPIVLVTNRFDIASDLIGIENMHFTNQAIGSVSEISLSGGSALRITNSHFDGIYLNINRFDDFNFINNQYGIHSDTILTRQRISVSDISNNIVFNDNEISNCDFPLLLDGGVNIDFYNNYIHHNNSGVRLTNVRNGTIKGCRISENKYGIDINGYSEKLVIGSDQEPNLISDNNGLGLSLDTVIDLTIQYNTIFNNLQYGVIVGNSEHLIFDHNTIENTRLSNFGYQGDGLFISNIANTHFADNRIMNNRGYGISIGSINEGKIYRNVISSDSIHGFRGGLRIREFASNVQIGGAGDSSNIITNSASNGIYIDSSENIVIHNNEINHHRYSGISIPSVLDAKVYQNTISQNGSIGINISHNENTVVEMNTIMANSGMAISGNTSTNLSIWSNQIGGMDTTYANGGGIALYGIGRDITIGGVGALANDIRNNKGSGITIGEGLNLNLINNNISSNRTYGVIINKGNNTNIQSNLITRTKKSLSGYQGIGISISNVEGATIQANTLTSNLGYAIHGRENSSVTIQNNEIGGLDSILANGGGISLTGVSKDIIIGGEGGLGNSINYSNGIGVNIGEVSNLDIDYNVISNHQSYGINIGKSTNTNIRNNKLYSNKNLAVRAFNASDIDILSNRIGGIDTTFANGGGISLSGVAKDVIIGGAGDLANEINHNNGSGLGISEVAGLNLINNNINHNQTFSANISKATKAIIQANNFSNTRKSKSGNQGTGLRINISDGVVLGGLIEELMNSIQDNLDFGVFVSNSSNIKLEGNAISNNGSNGINILSCKECEIQKNSIDSNEGLGIYIYSAESSLYIGDSNAENKNIIQNNNGGIQSYTSGLLEIGINKISCNTASEIQVRNSEQVIITEVSNSNIRGSAPPNSTVFIYANDEACSSCGLNTYVDTVLVDGEGKWEIATPDEIKLVDRISAIALSENGSSKLSSCKIAEIIPDCDNSVLSYPYINDFESSFSSDIALLGEGIRLYDTTSCNQNQQNIVFYDAYKSNGEVALFFLKSFDLTESAEAKLQFDIAHGRSYSNTQSMLSILVSEDCGLSFDTLYKKDTYSGLYTFQGNDVTVPYFPSSCMDWRTDIIDLSKYNGKRISIIIKAGPASGSFRGQNLFLDNIIIERNGECPLKNNEDEQFYIAIPGDTLEVCRGHNQISHTYVGDSIGWFINGIYNEEFSNEQNINVSGLYEGVVYNEKGCALRDSVFVIISDDNPYELGSDRNICSDTILLSLPDDDSDYIWSKDGDQIEEYSNQLLITEGGIYELEVTTYDNCIYHDEIEIKQDTDTLWSFSLEPNCGSDTIVLSFNPDIASIKWYLDDDEIPTENDDVSIMIESSGVYRVAFVTTAGCSYTHETYINYEEQLLDFDLGDTIIICSGNTIGLSTKVGYEYEWRYNGGSVEFYTSLIKPERTGAYELTVYHPNGCTLTKSVYVEKTDNVGNVQVIRDATICNNEPIEIRPIANDVESYTWYLRDEVVSQSQGGSLITSTEGTYILVTKYLSGCQSIDTVSIQESINLLKAIEGSYSICQGSELDFNPNLGETPYKLYYEDELINDVMVGPTSLRLAGTYRIEAYTINECFQEMEFSIIEDIKPDLKVNSEYVLCKDQIIELEFNELILFGSWIFNGQVIADYNYLKPEESGTYYLEYQTESCTYIDTINIAIGTSIDLSSNQYIDLCQSEIVNLSPGIFSYYQWSTGESTPSITIASTNPESTYNDELTVSVTTEEGCTASQTIHLTYMGRWNPELSTDQSTICLGESTELFVSEADRFNWIGIDHQASVLSVSPKVRTLYKVEVFGPCPMDSMILSQEINISSSDQVSVSEDVCVFEGQEVQLSVFGGNEVKWDNHPSILSDPSLSSVTVLPAQDTTFYRVLAIDPAGCEIEKEVMVCIRSIDDVFNVNNVITPNGDNVNDYLEFEDLTLYPPARLTVFDRWGKVVFENEAYQYDQPNFTGKDMKGSDLPEGTYFYLLQIEDASISIRKSITIVR